MPIKFIARVLLAVRDLDIDKGELIKKLNVVCFVSTGENELLNKFRHTMPEAAELDIFDRVKNNDLIDLRTWNHWARYEELGILPKVSAVNPNQKIAVEYPLSNKFVP